MKMDKKSLIEYDYNLYKNQYDKIQKDLLSSNDRNDENLTKDSLRKWLNEGIFVRRLNLRGEDGNYYITTATINRGTYKFGNDYLLSYWERKAESLMRRYINDHEDEDRLRKLDLIGTYKPFEDNLLDVVYETISGKESIKDAKRFLSGEEIDYIEDQKIDIDSFFRLKFELASQGMQAKALYDEESCIIDGAAGTGKSTIAIQKLKFFYENNVEENKLLIIIRNRYLKHHFSTLLNDNTINLGNVKIQTLDEAFDAENIKNIEALTKKAKKIKHELENLSQKREIDFLQLHYGNLFNFISIDFFKGKLTQLLDNLKAIDNSEKVKRLQNNILELEHKLIEYQSSKDADINEAKINEISLNAKLLNEDVSDYEEVEIQNELELIKLELLTYDKKIKNYKNKIRKNKDDINKLNGVHYEKILETINSDTVLSLTMLNDILGVTQKNSKELPQVETLIWLLDYKNYLQGQEKARIDKKKLEVKLQEKEISKEEIEKLNDQIKLLDIKLQEKYKKESRKYFDQSANMMKIVYFSKKYFQENNLVEENEGDIIYNFLDMSPKEFDTIMVDEAQDFSKFELEYIRLHTNRIVLTGDILQNIETSHGLNDWSDILNIDFLQKEDDSLNKYSLKHNFRQTYQLANASYNYRQVLLNESIEDIGFDYFENEKTFNGKEYPKPTLSLFDDQFTIMDYIKTKIEHIVGVYSKRFPIVVVYKDNNEKDFYTKVFSEYNIATKKIDVDSDIILMELNEVKGEEFPIVMANMNSFTEKELYLIMTRAQFELDFFIESYENFNPVMYELINNRDHIHFIELVDIDIHRVEHKSIVIQTDEPYLDKSILETNDFDVDTELESEDTEEGETPSTRVNIPKHEGRVDQWDEELDPDIIIDESKYQEDFTSKVKEDLHNYDSDEQEELIEKIVYVKKSDNKEKNKRNAIKEFLQKTYKGYCQVCGFTFRKVKDGKNSFKMFNWNDKRVVKRKKSFVTTADSLCLCRNCSANIKWGAFKATFMDKVENIEDFWNEDIDNIKTILHEIIDEDTADVFREHLDFEDMYALEIYVNEKPKNIYFTNEHLIQFIAYLQLENH